MASTSWLVLFYAGNEKNVPFIAAKGSYCRTYISDDHYSMALSSRFDGFSVGWFFLLKSLRGGTTKRFVANLSPYCNKPVGFGCEAADKL